jgi:hypothetical protein
MNFGTLNEFQGIQNGKNWKKKHGAQYWAAIRPMALHRWLSPEGKMANQPMPLVRCGVTWRGHLVLPPHGGAAVTGASVAEIGLGLHQKGGVRGWHRAWSRWRKLTRRGGPRWGSNGGLGGDVSGGTDELQWKTVVATGSYNIEELIGSETL